MQAVFVGLMTTLGFALLAPRNIWVEHTPFNHFALLAQSWSEGHLHLSGNPPGYAGGNDFALADGKWYVVFPGFPALLIWPWVLLSGGVESVLDGAFFVLLSGLAPAGLCLLLHRARQATKVALSDEAILIWSLLYAFGSVYCFTAVQGTVWFAAHVVAAAAVVFFLWSSVEVSHPLLAGIFLASATATRTHLLAFGIFYVFEVYRVMARERVEREDYVARAANRLFWFGLPVAITAAALAYLNYVRFGSVAEFGYRYLTVAWQARMEKWGLFDYHYLGRNLGIALTSLPYIPHGKSAVPFQVNGHGLALWVTSPFYLWLLWPRQQTFLHRAVCWTLPLAMLPSLLYQNSGWLQFGQRFSNDYAPLLFVLLALGGYTWSRLFKVACIGAIVVNVFGALTFGRAEFRDYYYIEPSQRVIYQPD